MQVRNKLTLKLNHLIWTHCCESNKIYIRTDFNERQLYLHKLQNSILLNQHNSHLKIYDEKYFFGLKTKGLKCTHFKKNLDLKKIYDHAHNVQCALCANAIECWKFCKRALQTMQSDEHNKQKKSHFSQQYWITLKQWRWNCWDLRCSK